MSQTLKDPEHRIPKNVSERAPPEVKGTIWSVKESLPSEPPGVWELLVKRIVNSRRL